MREQLTRLIMGTVLINCPLCKEKYRIRYNLFTHIRKEHTLIELEMYLKKKKIKWSNDN